MAADQSAAELERFLAERADHLLARAVLLTGSREADEDLLQSAVERCCGGGAGSTGIPRATCAGRCATVQVTSAGPRYEADRPAILAVWLTTPHGIWPSTTP
jgi:hypothetical protein